MCGIAGAIGHLDDEVIAAVRRASERERHRGPDADGFFQSAIAGPGVAFAHRRLAIIDLSADGIQPMTDSRSGAVIVFNGEIYNYLELREELAAAGVSFGSRTDTEVLLQSYLYWGVECLPRLRGMFAFALWDPRRRRVLLARDRLGIKPLYYARVARPGNAELLLFASELRAILATGFVERRLDAAAVETYLWQGFVAGEQSIVQGARRLEPGTSALVELDGLRSCETRYWSLPPYSPNDDALAVLGPELEKAVRLRLVSDVPLGIFLSGGIDSSAVTALASRAAPGGIRTFNVAFEEASFDESAHARTIAQHLGAEHTEVRLSQESFVNRLDDALSALDQPTFDAINTYFVSRAVREAGITVALAGTGGDELFGGYASFSELPRLAALARLGRTAPRGVVRALAGFLRRTMAIAYGPVPPQVRWGKLADLLCADGLLELYQLSYALFTPHFSSQLAPELAARRTRVGLSPARVEALEKMIAGSPLLHAVAMLELASFVGERLLPDTDAASMAVALEVRVPLLDHRVIELLAGVAPAHRFEPLPRKQLLRDLALGGLDPALFERPKQGFVLPIGDWLHGRLRDRVSGVFADRVACQAVGLDPDAVGRLWNAYQQGTPGIYWSRPWSLFVLLDWCRREGASL